MRVYGDLRLDVEEGSRELTVGVSGLEVRRAGSNVMLTFGVHPDTSVNTRVRRHTICNVAKSTERLRDRTNVCKVSRRTPRSISPLTEFQGRDVKHTVFCAFQRPGALTAVAWGAGRLDCFQPSECKRIPRTHRRLRASDQRAEGGLRGRRRMLTSSVTARVRLPASHARWVSVATAPPGPGKLRLKEREEVDEVSL